MALTALTLQLGVVIFFSFSVYNLDLSLSISSDSVPDSALPVTVAGTLAVTTGVFICTCVVEARTRLTQWIPKDNSHSLRIMWLQKAQVLGTNTFSSVPSLLTKADMRLSHRYTTVKEILRFGLVLALLSRPLVSLFFMFILVMKADTTVGFICQLIGFVY